MFHQASELFDKYVLNSIHVITTRDLHIKFKQAKKNKSSSK